jgi:hypothetical protein
MGSLSKEDVAEAIKRDSKGGSGGGGSTEGGGIMDSVISHFRRGSARQTTAGKVASRGDFLKYKEEGGPKSYEEWAKE